MKGKINPERWAHVTGHILPEENARFNIGDSTHKIGELHVGGRVYMQTLGGLLPASGTTRFIYLTCNRELEATGQTDRMVEIFYNNKVTTTGEAIGIKVGMRNTGDIGTIRGVEVRTDQRTNGSGGTIVQLMGFHNEMRIYAGRTCPSGFFSCFYGNIQVHAAVDAGAYNCVFLARDFSSGSYTPCMTAAFGVGRANAASRGFEYILDCYDPIADQVAHATAQIRMGVVGSENVVIKTGHTSDGSASTCGEGSLLLDTTDGKLFITRSSQWEEIAEA